MAMSIGASSEGPMTDINTTPLIDVMLVLLIMLIITLPAMTHSIDLQMPGGPAQEHPFPEMTGVLVDFDGTILWDGEVIAGVDALENRMRVEARRVPQRTLKVSADRRAQYDTVAQVLAIAQRSGMERIAIEGTP